MCGRAYQVGTLSGSQAHRESRREEGAIALEVLALAILAVRYIEIRVG